MHNTLIFDLDGTLLNTLEDLNRSVNFALKKFGFVETSLKKTRKSVGNGIKKLVSLSLPEGTDEETTEKVRAEMMQHYQKHCHDLTMPYPGILPLLNKLKTEGFRLAIVSNKADPMVRELRQVFFDDLISVAVGESAEIRRKPAPDMVFEALRQLGASVEDAVYIGDSEVDLKTAENAGLPCLSVSWGFRSEAQLMDHGAKTICANPERLYDFIHNSEVTD